MSHSSIAFSDKSSEIQEFLKSQNIELSSNVFDELLVFLSKACMYEEEERKIKPSIIIGHNLLDEEFLKITQATAITFLTEPNENVHLAKRLKAFLPFCNNGWRVFVNIEENISWGIVRNFNGLGGLEYSEILSTISEEDKTTLETDFILIDTIDNYAIKLSGFNHSCTIDFRLKSEAYDIDSIQKMFCSDLLRDVDYYDNKIYNAFFKVIRLFGQKLHGSICLVIQHNYSIPDETITDGIFLENPIDIYSILAKELYNDNSFHEVNSIINSHQKYHALTGVLLEMLNIDGATIVDTKGRIRAFNVFLKPDSNGCESISGGARKRAADYLKRQTNKGYIGVYFQSQDGMISYERNNHE